MERRYEVRLQELLDDAVVSPEQVRGLLERLERFVEPFAACLVRSKQRELTQQYVAGLVSQVERKNVESIAYHHDQDRQALQKFVGQYTWDHRPLIGELVRQVGGALGREDAVLVFDPSAFPKKGTESVGVQRQWCGRLGKVDNCQVGVYLGYASAEEAALVDVRLYLPKKWARSKARRAKCGVPADVKFHTRHELSLEMLDEHGAALPHGWVAGDDEMGKVPEFRAQLHARGERYLLAVPSNTLVRDLEAEPPPYAGRGRHPKSPWTRVDRWCKALPASAWTTIDVRDGAKGPLVVEAVKVRVQAKTAPLQGLEETLVVIRERQGDGTWKHDYYLSNAPHETPLAEFARVSKEEHRIEECLERAKSDAGLADYEVRTWRGWHHHQTLSLVATWFLTQEARQGKKIHASDHGSASPHDRRGTAASQTPLRPRRLHLPPNHTPAAAN
jgi:SRSO17 transposase